MFTVRRLGITGQLATTLITTNCIESTISVARTTTGNVKNWKDGTMKKRWVAAAMLEAERNFRRVRGCTDIPTLVAALARHTPGDPVTPDNYDQAAA
jgi:putative transposase